MARIDDRYESQAEEPCCPELALPLRECHRDDVAAVMQERGATLWCCACGRFWSHATPEELAAAFARAEE